ncbi:HugZ family protein [Terasakiella pusilla]|uniref:HugZ family pyridoxamine 5'-phosphate oxidase n=1 Tax=Terasakiella pusilla TaxID=64973 RepID=UPI003AA860B4
MKKELPLVPSSDDVGFEARKVLRNCVSGVIGTVDRDEGYAYTSFGSIGITWQGEPIFLWSDLSDHTQNAKQDPRVSLLCEQASHRSNPQAGARVTLVGTVRPCDDDVLKAQYFAKHPSAQMYAGFDDFNFYAFTLKKAHSVGGFGKAVWVERDHFLCDAEVAALFADSQDQLITAYSAQASQLAGAAEAELSRIDPDGLDLRLKGRNLRLDFSKEVASLDEARAEIELLLSKV